ncbi:MAG: hypothetical protein QXG39_02865 [Candidatus Aenigmatarchaeota archaeon]
MFDWKDAIAIQIIKEAAKLTYRQRQRLPDSAFAIPEERKYPIHDIAHARNALARVAQFGTPEERERVRRAVYARYPELREQREERIGRRLTREDLRKRTLPKK